jgi:hypothetical protein
MREPDEGARKTHKDTGHFVTVEHDHKQSPN